MNNNTKSNLILSVKYVSVISLFYVLLITLAVYFIFKKTLLEELEITAFIITLSLFIFIFYSLFRGVYFKHDPVNKKFSFDKFTNFNASDAVPIGFDISSGIWGAILSAIFWVIISIIIILLIEILWSLIFILIFLAVYWITFKALKLIQRHSLKCRGNIVLSLKYSLIYSFLYSGWFILVFYISKKLFIKN